MTHPTDAADTPELFKSALSQVDAYLAVARCAESTFGKMAVGDAGFVQRLLEGRATGRIAQRALDYIAVQEAAAVVLGTADRAETSMSCKSDNVRDAVRSPEKTAA